MRAAWLEPHDVFEGVGAHELNPRYDPQPGDGYDTTVTVTRRTVPALKRASVAHGLADVTGATRFDGIDGSHYQYDKGPVDVDLLTAASSGWVAWKATQSTGYIDPSLSIMRPRLTGFRNRLWYHWLSSTTDPTAQAKHYLQTVGEWPVGEGAMIDAEEAGITVAGVLAFAHVVETRTRRPCSIYTGAYVAGGTIWQNTGVRSSLYGPRPMHLAAYTTELRARSLPGVKSYPWDAWQYSSNGPVAGIVGRCDMNRVDDRYLYDLETGTIHAQEGEPTMSITNAQPYPDGGGGTYPPGVVKWGFDEIVKRRMTAEYGELYPNGNPNERALSNGALASIPDWTPPDGGNTGAQHGTWST